MAGVAISAEIDERPALLRIAEVLRRIENPTAALELAGAHMLRSIQKNFAAGGRPER
jgi:hypothetical protein